MVLDEFDRGYLENLIDREIKLVPSTMELARMPRYQKEWQIKSDADLVLGWAVGDIFTGFGMYYSNLHKETLPSEDLDQAVDIVIKRVREIREAIFKCG